MITKKQQKQIIEDFEEWKGKYDYVLSLDNLDKTRIRGRGNYDSQRRELIDETYIINESSETIFSRGMMLWLFIKLMDKKKPRSYGQLLEEMKINHRLKLFNINVDELDEEQIRKHFQNTGGQAWHSSQA